MPTGEARQTLPVRVALHYLGCAAPSGGGIAVKGAVGPLVDGLAERFASVDVVAYDPPSGPQPADVEDMTDYTVTASNVSLVSLGPKGSRRDVLARRGRVARIVAAHSPAWDVLVLRLVNRRAHLVAGPSRCPRVVSIVGGYAPQVALASRGPLRRRARLLATAVAAERHVRRILRQSLVLVNSEMLLDRYRGIAPDAQILRTPTRRAALSHQAGDRLTSPAARLLVPGRLSVDKGVLEAVRAFARLRSSVLPAAELHVVGTGEAEDAMRRLAGELGVAGHVTFHGWIPPGPELFEQFTLSDVCLSLSHAESLPSTIWEAMAHSVLVVSTAVGSIPRTFRDGDELVLVDRPTPDAVEHAVRRLVCDPDSRRRMLRRAYDRAQRETALESIADQLVQKVGDRWPELRQAGGRGPVQT